MRPALTLAILVLAGACQMTDQHPPGPGTATPPPPPPPPDTCGAAALQSLIGGPVPARIQAGGPVRIFAEGDAVTMDYNAQRVNVLLDGATRSRILAITCG